MTVADNPYFGDRLDTHATLGVVLGRTSKSSGRAGPDAHLAVRATGRTDRARDLHGRRLGPHHQAGRAQAESWRSRPGHGRNEIISVYGFGGRITPAPLAGARDGDGQWIGGIFAQWAGELRTVTAADRAAVLKALRLLDRQRPQQVAGCAVTAQSRWLSHDAGLCYRRAPSGWVPECVWSPRLASAVGAAVRRNRLIRRASSSSNRASGSVS